MTVAAKPTGTTQVVPWHRNQRVRSGIQNWTAFFFLTLGAILFLAPAVWMISTSLKGAAEVFTPDWIPANPQWNNYIDSLNAAPFGTYFRNTIFVAALSVTGAVLSSSLVAYSFARLRWPGRNILFGIVLSTMLLPGIVTFIPQYILFSKLGFVNTYVPLI